MTVSVNVVEAPDSDAHFHLRVIRQQNPNEIRYEGENSPKQLLDPNVQRTATLLQNDLTVTPHKSAKPELSKRMTFEVRPAMEKLPGYEETQGAILVKFNDKNEIADDSGIKGLMAVLQPWPAATIGFNLIPYFNSSLGETKETADARVATIRNTYGARVLTVYAPADASTKPFSISSSLRETAATSRGWVRLDLSPDPGFQPAPYSVAAHEVGHMFGNVDFYRDDQRNVAEKETASVLSH